MVSLILMAGLPSVTSYEGSSVLHCNMKKRWRLIGLLLGLLVLVLGVWIYYAEKIPRLAREYVYDWQYPNPDIHTSDQLDSLLKCFRQVSVVSLDEEIKGQLGLRNSLSASVQQPPVVYCLTKQDLCRKIVGPYRIRDFISPDLLQIESADNKSDSLYWPMDKRILKVLIELRQWLDQQGYDAQTLSVRSAYRSPSINWTKGGATLSRHMSGDALDLEIGDINRDGTYSPEDKEIVERICDVRFIGNKGGIGRYPGSRVLHIDLRGHRARWNTYTPHARKKQRVP